MRVLGKFIFLLAVLAGLYIGLSQINWMKHFQVEKNENKLEKKLGDLIIKNIDQLYEQVDEDSVKSIIDSLALPLLKDNSISSSNYKFHVIRDTEVNAFALPDDHILITTGLIQFLDSADYLSAIIAHEVAHCEKNHVMKALVTNFGLDLLLSGSGTGEVTNFLTGQAFSRKLEKEADETAVKYLMEANINPKSLANVMELFDIHFSSDADLSWISSHPASMERKEYINKSIQRLHGEASEYKHSIRQETWNKLQELVSANEN